MSLLRPSARFPLQRRTPPDNEAKAVLAAVQDQLQNYAQVHHALQLLFFKHAFEAAQLCVSAAAILNKRRVCAEVLVTMNPQEFGKMRKQVIAAATAIVLGIATTATGTTAFARGGGGGAVVAVEAMAVVLAAEVTALAVAVSEVTALAVAVSEAAGSRWATTVSATAVSATVVSRAVTLVEGFMLMAGDYEYGYCNPYYYPYGCYGY